MRSISCHQNHQNFHPQISGAITGKPTMHYGECIQSNCRSLEHLDGAPCPFVTMKFSKDNGFCNKCAIRGFGNYIPDPNEIIAYIKKRLESLHYCEWPSCKKRSTAKYCAFHKNLFNSRKYTWNRYHRKNHNGADPPDEFLFRPPQKRGQKWRK